MQPGGRCYTVIPPLLPPCRRSLVAGKSMPTRQAPDLATTARALRQWAVESALPFWATTGFDARFGGCGSRRGSAPSRRRTGSPERRFPAPLLDAGMREG